MNLTLLRTLGKPFKNLRGDNLQHRMSKSSSKYGHQEKLQALQGLPACTTLIMIQRWKGSMVQREAWQISLCLVTGRKILKSLGRVRAANLSWPTTSECVG